MSSVHTFIKAMTAMLPSSQALVELLQASTEFPEGPRGDRKRLQEICKLFYGNYKPNDPYTLPCNCPDECVLALGRAFASAGGRALVKHSIRFGNENVAEWALKIAWMVHLTSQQVCRTTKVKLSSISSGNGSDICFSEQELEELNSHIATGNGVKFQPNKKKSHKLSINPRDWVWEGIIHEISRREYIPVTVVNAICEVMCNCIRLPKQKAGTGYLGRTIREITHLALIVGTDLKAWSAQSAPALLEILMTLLVNSEVNRAIFARQPHWQTWLLPFLEDMTYHSGTPEEVDRMSMTSSGNLFTNNTETLFKWTISIFTQLHFHYMTSQDPNVLSVLNATCTAITEHFGWTEEGGSFWRVMLFSLLRRIMNDKHTFKLETYRYSKNLVKVLELVEHFIFFEPFVSQPGEVKKSRLGLHLNQDGSCQDLILVVAALDVFENFNLSSLDHCYHLEIRAQHRLQDIKRVLSDQIEFFGDCKEFFKQLETESIENTDSTIRDMVAMLERRRNNSNRFGGVFGISKKKQLEKQLAVVVQNQKTMLQVVPSRAASATVTVDDFVESSRRQFSNATYARTFCDNKRRDMLQQNPEFHAMSVRKKKKVSTPCQRQIASISSDDVFRDSVNLCLEEDNDDRSLSDISEGSIYDDEFSVFDIKEEEFTEDGLSEKVFVRTISAYTAEQDDEVSLEQGVQLEVLQRNAADGRWLVIFGTQIGYVPSVHLEIESEPAGLALDLEESNTFTEADFAWEPADLARDLRVISQSLSRSTVDVRASLECHFCKIPLSYEEFFEHDGIICCKDDLLKHFLKCTKCTKPIEGSHLLIGERTFHTDCITCTTCNEFLDLNEIYENGDNLYCETHFNEQFGIKCGHCSEYITDSYLVALGQNWHRDHFMCSGKCGTVLPDDYFVSYNQAYCLADYKEDIADKCGICNLPVLETGLGIDGVTYHGDCVHCSVCSRKHSSGLEFYPDVSADGVMSFLCSEHYTSKYHQTCAGCNLSIDDEERAVVDNKYYHFDCLRCSSCQDSLKDQEIFAKDDKLYCKTHYMELVLESCSICGLAISSTMVTLGNDKVHVDCLKCSICERALYDTDLGIHMTEDGKYVCKDDFLKLSAEMCHECELPILDKMLKVGEWFFHSHCLVCSTCKTPLDGKKMLLVGNEIRCEEHVK